MTRIAISTLIVRPGLSGSNESYLVNLVSALREVDQDNDYLLFVTPRNAHLFSVSDSRCQLIHVPRWAYSRLGRIALDQFIIPFWAVRLGAAVLHYPGSGGSSIKLNRLRQVVTVHYDIDPAHAPSVSLLRRAHFTRSMRQNRSIASAIIVPSYAFGQSLATRWAIPPSKLRVVHHGVQTRNGSRIPSLSDHDLLRRLGVTPGYLLSVTNALPHKNVPCLLEAYAELMARTTSDVSLVIVGDISPSTLRKWQQELASKGVRLPLDRIILTGVLASDKMGVLYRHAALMVTPTLTESFSFPVLEAMINGCPVVVSDIPVHREIGGSAAILVDPRFPSQIADACASVLSNADWRAALVQRGLQHARQLSWERTARETVAVYSSVL